MEEEEMKRSLEWLFFSVSLAAAARGWGQTEKNGFVRPSKPVYDGEVSVERAIKERRTIRDFQPKPLTLDQLSQLVWSPNGKRMI